MRVNGRGRGRGRGPGQARRRTPPAPHATAYRVLQAGVCPRSQQQLQHVGGSIATCPHERSVAPLLEIGGARREARGGQRRVTGERGRTRRVRQAHRAAERRERTRRATHVRARRAQASATHTHTHTHTQQGRRLTLSWWLRLAFLSMSNLATAGLLQAAALTSGVSPSCSSGGGSTAHMRSGGAGGGRAGSERERATRAGAPHPPPRAGVGSRVSERRRRRGGAERRDARRERAWRRRARRRRRRRRHGRACTSASRPHPRARRHAAQGGRRT